MNLIIADYRLIGDPYSVPPRKYFSVGYFVEYPVGTGHVHITSGEDVNAPPDFDTGYLTKYFLSHHSYQRVAHANVGLKIWQS